MTLHIYSCETRTIRSEMVRREKPDGTFYGLRLHMNTDQVVTFWARSQEELQAMVMELWKTTQQPASRIQALPGQFSPSHNGG